MLAARHEGLRRGSPAAVSLPVVCAMAYLVCAWIAGIWVFLTASYPLPGEALLGRSGYLMLTGWHLLFGAILAWFTLRPAAVPMGLGRARRIGGLLALAGIVLVQVGALWASTPRPI